MVDLIDPQTIAVVIFLVTYFLIATGWREKAATAMAGAAVLWGLGVLSGEELIGFIDLDTLALLFGLMIVTGCLTSSGFFRWIGIGLANFCKCRPVRMLLMFTLISAVFSAFLPNIATILFMVAVIIDIMETLKVDPMPYVFAVILASNIGGTATLIGDPPNMMIATASGMTFIDFILDVAPIVATALALVIVFLYFHNKQAMINMESRIGYSKIPLEAKDVIRDQRLFTLGSLVLFASIALFFLHDVFQISPSTVAIVSAVVILFVGGPRMPDVFKEIEWDTLIFLAGIFVIIGGLEKTGFIHEISTRLFPILGGNQLLAVSMVLWISTFASAFIDNIPFTATFIPLLQELGLGIEIEILPLWWGLSLGAGLGGNGTLIGSVVNIVAVGAASKRGYTITFKDFMRVGMLTLLITTATANALLILKIL